MGNVATHPFYTFIWVNNGEKDFREKNPLELLGASIKRWNTKLHVTVVILEGAETLSEDYKRELKTLGFEILEYGEQFKKIAARFPNIVRTRTPYIRNCFLRWVALEEITAARKEAQVWHIDSDLMFYASLDEIAEDTAGKTFAIQGGPAFTSISDRNWFTRFIGEIENFERDMETFTDRT